MRYCASRYCTLRYCRSTVLPHYGTASHDIVRQGTIRLRYSKATVPQRCATSTLHFTLHCFNVTLLQRYTASMLHCPQATLLLRYTAPTVHSSNATLLHATLLRYTVPTRLIGPFKIHLAFSPIRYIFLLA